MRRRRLPPVDDVKRTLRRTALLAVSAGTLAAAVGCQSATGLATHTRGRLGRAFETVARTLHSPRFSSREVPDDSATTTVSADERVDGPTTRDQLAESGLVPRTYVHGVLREHGGRMKQRRFSEEYGWSASTVSRLLSDLEDDGEIERYKVGREKVVCLPRYGCTPEQGDAGPARLERRQAARRPVTRATRRSTRDPADSR